MVDSFAEAEIAFHGKTRSLCCANVTVRTKVDRSPEHRIAVRHGDTTSLAADRGMDAHGPLLMTGDGAPFACRRRVTFAGTTSNLCETLVEIYRRASQQAGIPNGNASAK